MRIYLHGPLTPAVDDAIKRHGHTPLRAGQAGLDPTLEHRELLAETRKTQLDLLTADRSLIETLLTVGGFNRSVIYLQLPGESLEQDDAIDRLFNRYKRLTPGQLYTVTETRVKVRQIPSVKVTKPRSGGEARVSETHGTQPTHAKRDRRATPSDRPNPK